MEVNGKVDYSTEDIQEIDVLEVLGVRDLNFENTKILTVSTKNPILQKNTAVELKLDNFPKGISKVPFLWKYGELEIDMQFISGLIGIKEDDNVLKTKINWVVAKAA